MWVLYRSRARTQTRGLARSSGSHFTEVRSDMPAEPGVKNQYLIESSGEFEDKSEILTVAVLWGSR